MLAHRERALETLEEPLGAAREDAEVARAGEDGVDERVLRADHLHEPLVVDHTRRREPVVGLQHRDVDALAVVTGGDLATDAFEPWSVDLPADQPPKIHV